jgi:hypothetical protein
MINTWIFQSNLNTYDMKSTLLTMERFEWLVSNYEKQIGAGDTVYLWEAQSGGGVGGIIAVGRIQSNPTFKKLNDRQMTFVRDHKKFLEPHLFACIKLEKVLKRPILRKELKNHPILKDMLILGKFPSGTNFKVRENEVPYLISIIK